MLEICLRAFKVLQNFSPSLSIKTLRGFFILPFPVVTSHSMKETGIIEIMKGHRIIPDLIDEAPFDILEVHFVFTLPFLNKTGLFRSHMVMGLWPTMGLN